MSKPAWLLRLEAERRGRPQPPSEAERIVNLPVCEPVSQERIEELSRENVQAGPFNGDCDCDTCRGRPFRLLPDQAAGLHAFLSFDHGPFAAIRVGGGKTGLCMLIASHYLQKHPDHKALVLIPASIVSQFARRDLLWGRQHLAIGCSWYVLGGRTAAQRRTLAQRGPGAYVLPYSCLSTTDTEEILKLIDPDLVVADEAQNLRGDSAKTKRFWGFVNRRKPTPRGVCMSGTLTSTEPMDYHKLIKWCMGPNSPLPRTTVEAATWSEFLRSRAPDPDPSKPEKVRPIRPLVEWARKNGERVSYTTEGIRKAYRRRMHTAPGFVSSPDRSLGISLELENVEAASPGDKLTGLWADVINDWLSPNGDVLTHGIELHSTLRELSAGFYYKRFWPEDHPLKAQAIAHFEAGQEYFKELRQFFGSTIYPRPGLDTPLLVGKHHSDHGSIPGWEHLYQLWLEWKDLEREDLPERLSEPVWIDDYKIKHAVRWAKKQKRPGGILWCHHTAVAGRLIKALVDANLPVLRKGSGDTWLHDDGSDRFFCVASIRAHGTGKNLQHHHKQLLVQWPRPANQCEQLLGRTHRTGQKAERLTVQTNHTLDWDYEQQACTIADTVYQAETLGGRPKILIADWNPLPPQKDPEFIRAKYAFRSTNDED